MRCPYCGGAMEDGCIQSARPIAFVKKMRWVKIQSAEGDRRLPFSFLRGALLPACSCTHCKKIIISLEEEGDTHHDQTGREGV